VTRGTHESKKKTEGLGVGQFGRDRQKVRSGRELRGDVWAEEGEIWVFGVKNREKSDMRRYRGLRGSRRVSAGMT